MKSTIITLLFLLGVFALPAQEPIVVSGKFQKNNNSIKLSKEAITQLFVSEKGVLKLDEYNQVNLFQLSETDAVKLGQKVITVAQINDIASYHLAEIKSLENKEIKLKLYPLGNAKGAFYIKNINEFMAQVNIDYPELKIYFAPDAEYEKYKKALLELNRSTLFTSDFAHNSDDYRFTPEWIELLDSKITVNVEVIIYSYLSDGTCETSKSAEPMSIKELAREKLRSIEVTFEMLNPPAADKGTKQEWKTWLAGLNALKNNYKTLDYKTFSFRAAKYSNVIFASDEVTSKIYSFETRSINQKQNLIVLDTKNETSKILNLYQSKYDFTYNLEAVYLNNNHAYLLNKDLLWGNIKIEADNFTVIEWKNINEQLPKKYQLGEGRYFRNVIMYKDYMVVTLINKNNSYELLTIDTKTGKLIKHLILDSYYKSKNIDSKQAYNYIYFGNGANAFDKEGNFLFYQHRSKGDLTSQLFKMNSNLEIICDTVFKSKGNISGVLSDGFKHYLPSLKYNLLKILTLNDDFSGQNSIEFEIPKANYYDALTEMSATNKMILISENKDVFNRKLDVILADITTGKYTIKNIFGYFPIEEITGNIDLKINYTTIINQIRYVVYTFEGKMNIVQLDQD